MAEAYAQYLGTEPSINSTIAVGVASSEISIPKYRKAFSIRNTSPAAQVINLVLSNTLDAAAGVGIQLNVNESFIDSDSENYECWTGSIKAISSAVGGTLAVMERT